MIKSGQKYLITTEEWFIAPDGYQYRSAWGTCKILNIDEIFNFKVRQPSTNWYLEVGENGKEIIIAGCHIHYAVRSEKFPKDNLRGKFYMDTETKSEYNVSRIYIAE